MKYEPGSALAMLDAMVAEEVEAHYQATRCPRCGGPAHGSISGCDPQVAWRFQHAAPRTAFPRCPRCGMPDLVEVETSGGVKLGCGECGLLG